MNSRISIALTGVILIVALYLADSLQMAEVGRTISQPNLRIDDRYYEQYLKIRVQPTFGEWSKHYGKVYSS